MTLPPKILIVDDNPLNRDILERMLQSDGEVESVGSGEECLERVARSPVDVILLDVMMPGLNGYEVCRRLRNMPESKETQVIMVTGRAHPSEEALAYEAGADGYLTKPFTMAEVRERVRLACGQ